MSFWPFLPVWPFLLAGAGITAFWNMRAALVFAAAIISVRVFIEFSNIELKESFSQLAIFAIYSCIGVLAFLAFDKMSGTFVCLVALVTLGHIVLPIDWRAMVIITEIVLFLGMVCCAFNGPTGGLLASNHHFGNVGRTNSGVVWGAADPKGVESLHVLAEKKVIR